jgi:hypothetical protein
VVKKIKKKEKLCSCSYQLNFAQCLAAAPARLDRYKINPARIRRHMCTANLYAASHCSTSIESMPPHLSFCTIPENERPPFISTVEPRARYTFPRRAATRKPGPQDLRGPREALPGKAPKLVGVFACPMGEIGQKRGSARGHHTPKGDADTPSSQRISRRPPEKAGRLGHTVLRIRERRPGCCPGSRIDLMASSAHACRAQGCCL